MIEESCFMTLSVHKSKEGAQRAIDKHKEIELKKWKVDFPTKEDEPHNFEEFKDWNIVEVEVYP